MLKKIDKSKFPKPAQRWSFSVFFVYPVFVIANKLWKFLYIYLAVNLINFIALFSGLDKHIVNLVSIFTFIVLLFFTIYLVIYGRALAWQKLGYKVDEQGIAKFKFRQRFVLYINIILIGLLVIYFWSGLEYGYVISGL
ncbi:MAG: hypothetical protein Q8P32_04155 [Candidatus Komeilibacteria bacterium]|nr:hypothetical protein [Candidatus Komeilibacteria bacterium]